MTRLFVPLRLAQLSSAPPTPPTGYTSMYADTNGDIRVRHSAGDDSVMFLSKALTADVSGSQFSGASGGGTAATGIDFPVTAGRYIIRYTCSVTGAAATSRPVVQVTGPTAGYVGLRVHVFGTSTSNKQLDLGLGVWSANPGFNGGGTTAVPLFITGVVTFTASGTLGLKIATTLSGGTATLKAGSFVQAGRAW